jgi:hypothetical protein
VKFPSLRCDALVHAVLPARWRWAVEAFSGVQLDHCVGSMPSSNLGCQVTGTTLLLAAVWLLSAHNQMSHSPRCPTVHQSSAENG